MLHLSNTFLPDTVPLHRDTANPSRFGHDGFAAYGTRLAKAEMICRNHIHSEKSRPSCIEKIGKTESVFLYGHFRPFRNSLRTCLAWMYQIRRFSRDFAPPKASRANRQPDPREFTTRKMSKFFDTLASAHHADPFCYSFTGCHPPAACRSVCRRAACRCH